MGWDRKTRQHTEEEKINKGKSYKEYLQEMVDRNELSKENMEGYLGDFNRNKKNRKWMAGRLITTNSNKLTPSETRGN